MNEIKKRRLEAAGFRVGSSAEFLGLTEQERAFVEVKVALASYLRQVRSKQGLTQGELARRLASSQSRVAKMEAADASVSLDLLIRSLLTIGVSSRDLGRVIARAA